GVLARCLAVLQPDAGRRRRQADPELLLDEVLRGAGHRPAEAVLGVGARLLQGSRRDAGRRAGVPVEELPALPRRRWRLALPAGDVRVAALQVRQQGLQRPEGNEAAL